MNETQLFSENNTGFLVVAEVIALLGITIFNTVGCIAIIRQIYRIIFYDLPELCALIRAIRSQIIGSRNREAVAAAVRSNTPDSIAQVRDGQMEDGDVLREDGAAETKKKKARVRFADAEDDDTPLVQFLNG
uniref:Ion_trans domain-containing protein n=1 Tax=Steinernema glaseri TaxID=37863 RepID=A0A1I7YG77_9BILA